MKHGGLTAVLALLCGALGYWLGVEREPGSLGLVGSGATLLDERLQPSRVAPGFEDVEFPASESTDVASPGDVDDGRFDETNETFGPGLMKLVHQRFLDGWCSLRKDLPDDDTRNHGDLSFQDQAMSLPFSIGQAMAQRRIEEEAAVVAVERGDLQGLLDALREFTWKPDAQTFDLELMNRVFERSVTGLDVNAAALADKTVKAEDGMTVHVPAGIHKLHSVRLCKENGELPKDVTIRGAGKDATVLTLGAIMSWNTVENLRIENITLDHGEETVFDLPKGSLSLDLKNVRVLRFHKQSEQTLFFGTIEGAVIRAVDCEFLGNYGRWPITGGGGRSRSKPGWMYFRNCRFSALNLGFRDDDAVLFDSCRLERLQADPIPLQPSRFLNCTYEPTPDQEKTRRVEGLKISSLFPGFQD